MDSRHQKSIQCRPNNRISCRVNYGERRGSGAYIQIFFVNILMVLPSVTIEFLSLVEEN